MDAGLYLRISKDDGTTLAVERQEAECRARAAALGWSITKTYTDQGKSASDPTVVRNLYQDMLADAQSGKIQGLIAWSFDRFIRQPDELSAWLDLADRGFQVATVGGILELDTPGGRMTARTLAAVAEMEVRQKAARQVAKNRQQAASGELQPKIRPFGWLKTVTESGVHYNALDPVESAAIKSAAESIIDGTRSAGAIIKEWNTHGPSTSKGGKWSNDSFRKMMARPRNAGLQLHNGKIVGSAVCEPILTQEQYDLLQNIFTSRVKQVHPTGRTHAFSGIPVCDECDGRMYVSQVRTGGKVYLNYLCKSCQNNSIAKGVVDDFILTSISLSLVDPRMAAKRLGQAGTMQSLADARKVLAEIDGEAKQIMAADIALSDRLELLSQIKDKRVAAETTVQALINSSRIAGLLEGLNLTSAPVVLGDKPKVIKERFTQLSITDQNLIAAELVDIRIRKSPRKGKLTWQDTLARIVPQEI